MKRIALVTTKDCDAAGLLQVMERLSRRGPLRLGLFSLEPGLTDSQMRLMEGLAAMGATTSAVASVSADCLHDLDAELVIVQCDPAIGGPRGREQDLRRDLSRHSARPVWIMNGHTGPPASVTALIDPDRDDSTDPALAAEILRVSFTLARALDVPLDILNVWYFLEEGLLRSRRIRMPEQEITERRRRAAWIAQSYFARLVATLPPDLAWRCLAHVRGPVLDAAVANLPEDTLVVAGSEGRDGWAARLRPNLAEDLCDRRRMGIVIVRRPDNASQRSSDHIAPDIGPSDGTDQSDTEGPNRQRNLA